VIPQPVVSFSISESHLAALDLSGMVWIWGQNKKGELGLGDKVTRD